MKELFIIRDYDTGKITNIYLTDNAEGCRNALADAEKIKMANEDEDNEDIRETWEIFQDLLVERKITMVSPEDVVRYDY